MKKNKLQFISSLFSVIITFGIIFVLSFLKFDDGLLSFSWENVVRNLSDPAFWLTTSGLALLGVVAYNFSFRSRLQSLTTSEEFEAKNEEYIKKIDLKNKSQKEFQTFIKEKNIEKKKELYLEAKNKKIFRIENWMEKVEQEKLNLKGHHLLKWRWKKTLLKYELLKTQVEEDYINQKIVRIKVKGYQEIIPSYFKRDYASRNMKGAKYKNELEKRYAESMAGKILSRFAYAIIFTGIIVSTVCFQYNDALIITILGSSFQLFTSLASGITKANKLYREEITATMDDRGAFIDDFMIWMRDNGKKNFDEYFNDAINEKIQHMIDEKQEELEKNAEKVAKNIPI